MSESERDSEARPVAPATEPQEDPRIKGEKHPIARMIVIGLIVENLVFRNIERRTVRKWGVQS